MTGVERDSHSAAINARRQAGPSQTLRRIGCRMRPKESRGAVEWISEEVWRAALAAVQTEIRVCKRPDFILFHHGVLDAAYTRRYLYGLRRRLSRIKAAGLQEWRDRYKNERPTSEMRQRITEILTKGDRTDES